MITRIELIRLLLNNEGVKEVTSLYSRMINNLLSIDDYDFIQWYDNKFGHKLTQVRHYMYF